MLLVTASGTAVSYLYDEDASFAARLCGGACVGITALGLVGFIFSSFLGLTNITIFITVLLVAILPLFLLRTSARWPDVRRDLKQVWRALRQSFANPSITQIGYFIFYLVVSVVLWRVFQRAMIQEPEGIFTGVVNNFGDLPFHVSVITGFAFGNNFPPQDPTYAGVPFTYPFLTDFVSAVFVRCGADLRQSMFLENFVVAVAFVGLMHRWALEMLRDKLAAVLTPLLVLLNGGFGWIFLRDIDLGRSKDGLAAMIETLPSSFTINNAGWRWGNAMSTLLVPQRGFLLGLPLAVIVFTQWWKATAQGEGRGEQKREEEKRGTSKEKQKKSVSGSASRADSTPPRFGFPFSRLPFYPFTAAMKRMMAAGIIGGLIPLVHAHSFVVVMVVGMLLTIFPHRRATIALGIAALLCWCLILLAYLPGPAPATAIAIGVLLVMVGLAISLWWLVPPASRRLWLTFFITASIVALPQMWWSTHHSAVDAKKFLEWEFGWDHGTDNVFIFWLKNTGLFVPLTLAAILWRGREAVIPRRLLIFSAPFLLCFIIPNVLRLAPWIWDNVKVLFYWWLASAPLVAALLARLWRYGPAQKTLAFCLFVCLTLAGALDVASIVFRSNEFGIFDAGGIAFAEVMKNETPPNALVIHAPVHNHPVFLTGRRSLMGYPGHVWTHGLDYRVRESEIARVYAGAPDAAAILQKYKVEYAVLGPQEVNLLKPKMQVFSQFQLVGDVGGYRLYKIKF